MKKHIVMYSIFTIAIFSCLYVLYIQNQSIASQRAWLESRMLLRNNLHYFNLDEIEKEQLKKNLICDISLQARSVKYYAGELDTLTKGFHFRQGIDQRITTSINVAYQIAGKNMIEDEEYWEKQCYNIVSSCEKEKSNITNLDTSTQQDGSQC